MLEQIGTEMSGLGKLQYKIGIDFSQTIWDGGSSKASRAIAESENASRVAALDTELYAVRQRVENLFFGILLIEEQIKQAEQTKNLLERNLEKLKATYNRTRQVGALFHSVVCDSDTDAADKLYTVGTERIAEHFQCDMGIADLYHLGPLPRIVHIDDSKHSGHGSARFGRSADASCGDAFGNDISRRQHACDSPMAVMHNPGPMVCLGDARSDGSATPGFLYNDGDCNLGGHDNFRTDSRHQKIQR